MSSVFDKEIDGQVEDSRNLATLLERVSELRAEKDQLATETKAVNAKLEQLEQLAVEALRASGLQGVRAGGKSWFTQTWHSLSVPPENREAVLAAAREYCPEYIAVNTSSLKSWLKEQKGDGDGALADGTPFAGLVEEYSEVRLSHRSVA